MATAARMPDRGIMLQMTAPPSTNQLYSGRRFKTSRYRAWITEAGWELKLQHPPTIVGPFELTVWMPGQSDIDNVKAIPDLLKTLGVIVDDRRKYMRKLTVLPTDGPCRVEIVPL